MKKTYFTSLKSNKEEKKMKEQNNDLQMRKQKTNERTKYNLFQTKL